MKRLLRFKRRKARSGDLQGNSAITPSPPVGPEIITPSPTSIPASSLSVQATAPSVVAASSSPTTASAAQLQTRQAVAPVLPSAGSSPAPSTGASQDIDTWNRAYEIAEKRESELMTDYASHLASLQVNPTSKRNISNSEFVEDVVKRLLDDREKKQWRLSLLGNNVIIRKQVEKLAKVLLWSDPVVKSAVSTQPHAALAWSGVSILLPLLTSAVTPDEAMLKGFNSISDVQVYWTIFEETYLTSSLRQHYENLVEPLAKLYSYIIEYQARAICHLSKTQLSRGWQTVAGGNDWAGKASEIEALSKARSSLISHDNENEIRERWGRQLREIQESTAILGEIRQVLDESQRQTQGNYADMAERNLLQDLASDYEGYKDFNRLRVQGTCEWFFNDEKFRKWRDSDRSGLLWLSAGPGCGKSILSRALIDERRLSLNVTTSTVCHFFFKDGDEGRIYGVNALCAILHQLFTQDSSGALIKLALPAHRNYGKALTKSFSELWNILLGCAKSPHAGEVVCIFDALDECEEQSRLQLISKLKEFYCQPQGSSALSSKLSFLITSRPYAEIEREFAGFSTTEYLHFDGDKKSPVISREIDLVIDEHVSQIAENFTPRDQLKISKRLKSMENRTYLWLYVIFETIKEDPSRHGKRSSIEKLLNNIPSRLSEAYEVILGRSKCQEETERLLEIILAAAWPLTLDEANVALTLALAEEDFTSHAALKNDLWPESNFESIVKGLSGLFISVHDSKLFLIHQTAREFLIDPSGRGTWEGRLSMSKSSRTISRTCIHFLLLPDLRAFFEGGVFLDDDRPGGDLSGDYRPVGDLSGDDRPGGDIVDYTKSSDGSVSDYAISEDNFGDDEESEDNSGGHRLTNSFTGNPKTTLVHLPPFFRYAANHWPSHFLSQEATVIDQFLKDARTLCNARQAWVRVTNSALGLHIIGLHNMTDLSLASYLGLKQVVENILSEERTDVNIRDESGLALSAACIKGQSDIVALLLNTGASCNALHGHVRSLPMDTRLYYLHDPPDHSTALQTATSFKHHDIVSMLLENGANVNINGRDGPALNIASRNMNLYIVLELLKWGADVNLMPEGFGTALSEACYTRDREIVKVLLENGADANKGGPKDKPLHTACYYSHSDIVIDLLNHGADIDYHDGVTGTALWATSSQGRENIVAILLANGADPNIRGGEYDGSAISEASNNGHQGVVELLLKHGADVNLRDARRSTALQAAAWQGHREIVGLLLNHGADVNIRDAKRSTALQAAAWRGHREIVTLLLNHGADITMRGEGGYLSRGWRWYKGTALDAATKEGHTEIIEILAEKEAEVRSSTKICKSNRN